MAQTKGGMRWAFAGVSAMILVYGCGKGTPKPPFTDVDSTSDSTHLMAVCGDPKLDFSGRGATAEVAPGVRVEIIPESHSNEITSDELEKEGRVIAKVRLLDVGGSYDGFDLKDRTPACWFVKGPKHKLISTIFTETGIRLKGDIETHAKLALHRHAEAHWELVKVKDRKATFDPRPSELHAEAPESAARSEAYTRAILDGFTLLAQGSCTKTSCCIAPGPH
jgi:hypothetical protein